MPTTAKTPRLASVLLCAASAIALCTLASYGFDIPRLAMWVPGTIAMKAVSAWIILEHAIAGFLLSRPDRRGFCMQMWLLAIVTFLMTLGLLNEISHKELAKFDPKFSFFPSVMTLTGGTLLALKAIMAGYCPRGTIANLLGACVALIGISALIGYLTNTPTLYFFIPGWTTSMAVNTALAFVLLGSVPVPHAEQ